ncbi:MAG TPA: hypothetical protein VGK73_26195 [Polyangiaceae bacterium]
MDPYLDSLSWAGAGPALQNRLLIIRATCATIPLSRTATPDMLQEAAFALDGLCVAMESVVEDIAELDASVPVTNLCCKVTAGIAQVRSELERRLLEPHRALVRARVTLLRALVEACEASHIASQRQGEAALPLDPLDVARAIILIAVRANPTQHEWIGAIADAEIALLATVPRERMDAEFLRRLLALRGLVAECANYESRRTSRPRALLGLV